MRFNKFCRYLRKRKKIVRNFYKTKYDNNVLICYITQPFLENKIKMSHTNIEMARIIAKVFSMHEYNVDVIDFNEDKEIKLDKYSIVFGWGYIFEKATLRKDIYTIAFLTGASVYFSNLAELDRIREVNKRTGNKLKLRRQANGLTNLESSINTDFAICHGNEWTLSTWVQIYENIITIDGFGFDTGGYVKRDLLKTRKNFLFISGSGNIHKGLDLCLEAFRQLPDYNLYVATKLDKDFEDCYREDFKHDNIHYLGFVDVNSEEYREFASNCLFCILPSCSEGMATSVLTSMDSGMIPVLTVQCGIDMEECGFCIKDISVDGIRDAIRNASSFDDEKLVCMSSKASQLVTERYNVTVFEKNFDKILTKLGK